MFVWSVDPHLAHWCAYQLGQGSAQLPVFHLRQASVCGPLPSGRLVPLDFPPLEGSWEYPFLSKRQGVSTGWPGGADFGGKVLCCPGTGGEVAGM